MGIGRQPATAMTLKNRVDTNFSVWERLSPPQSPEKNLARKVLQITRFAHFAHVNPIALVLVAPSHSEGDHKECLVLSIYWSQDLRKDFLGIVKSQPVCKVLNSRIQD
jgi:hypothetical protein